MKNPTRPTMAARLRMVLGSNKFFYLTLGLFGLAACWIALTSLYPMAFDEEFHVGLIRLYAGHWVPFTITQTKDTDVFGSVVTDPSYFYHYLMSFPYRLLHAVIGSDTPVIIILRLLNVGLFIAGLVVYRKVLLAAKLSKAAAHAVLAVFVAIPVVPLLAGQINYDNLLILIVALVLLLTIRVQAALQTKEGVSARDALTLALLLVFGAGVKYAFLPIAAGVVLYLGWHAWRALRANPNLVDLLWESLKQLRLSLKLVFGVLIVVGVILCLHRYIVNTFTYHQPIPDCADVLDEDRCQAYGPWGRDYNLALQKGSAATESPLGYTVHEWLWGMWFRLFFTLAGPTNNYATRQQLPVISYGAAVLFVGGVLAALWYSRRLFVAHPAFFLFVLVTIIYLVALWSEEYKMYLHTAQPVAINGRYLLLLLPALGGIVVTAYQQLFRSVGLVKYTPVALAVVLFIFLQGGGPITYIVRSEPRWFWHNNAAQDANGNLQKLLKPVIIGA